jgi:hypothetical protein
MTSSMMACHARAFLKGVGLIDSRGFGRGAVWYLVGKEAVN